jgi:ABC-type uncharacterized transport system substrate-binding protein
MFVAVSLFAHPHIFLEVFPSVKVKNSVLEEIKIKWIFDEMTSSMIMMDFDTNHNGTFEKDEVKLVKKEAFRHLIEMSYYTHLTIDGIDIKTPKAKQFDAKVYNHKVEYYFTLHFDTKIEKNLKLSFHDTDFYVAFVFKDDYILDKNSNFDYKVLEEDNDFYYGYALFMKKR